MNYILYVWKLFALTPNSTSLLLTFIIHRSTDVVYSEFYEKWIGSFVGLSVLQIDIDIWLAQR